LVGVNIRGRAVKQANNRLTDFLNLNLIFNVFTLLNIDVTCESLDKKNKFLGITSKREASHPLRNDWDRSFDKKRICFVNSTILFL